MLQINQQLQQVTLTQQQEQLKTSDYFTDKKIDALVYSLYELTTDEIKILEGVCRRGRGR
jgi:hypothetical protein